MSYLETTHNVYKEAALTPDVGLMLYNQSYMGIARIKNSKNHARDELWLWFYCTRPRFNKQP
jgi:hypothetical protein